MSTVIVIAIIGMIIALLIGAAGSGLFELIKAAMNRALQSSKRSLRKYLRAVAGDHEYWT